MISGEQISLNLNIIQIHNTLRQANFSSILEELKLGDITLENEADYYLLPTSTKRVTAKTSKGHEYINRHISL